jgi:hypothetical protein
MGMARLPDGFRPLKKGLLYSESHHAALYPLAQAFVHPQWDGLLFKPTSGKFWAHAPSKTPSGHSGCGGCAK